MTFPVGEMSCGIFVPVGKMSCGIFVPVGKVSHDKNLQEPVGSDLLWDAVWEFWSGLGRTHNYVPAKLRRASSVEVGSPQRLLRGTGYVVSPRLRTSAIHRRAA